MCGLFGFSGAVRLSVLQRLAALSSTRGTHAYGAQWATGRISGAGRWDDHLDQLQAVDGTWCVGVGRMATFGTWRNPANNQPLTVGNVTVVHNGNLYHTDAWLRANFPAYTPLTQTDTELVALALAHGYAPEALPHGPAAALIWHVDGERGLHIWRTNHPLYTASIGECVCISSRAWDDACELVPANTLVRAQYSDF